MCRHDRRHAGSAVANGIIKGHRRKADKRERGHAMSDMSIVEDSYYEHEAYGPVQLDLEVDGHVLFHSTEDTISGTDQPRQYKESIEAFRERAEPKDITIETPATSVDPDQPSPGDR